MLNWDSLNQYKKGGFLAEYPPHIKRFFAPDDDVHGAVVMVVKSAGVSLAASFFGWDDDEINALFMDAMLNESLPVQLALDKTQAGGVHEKEILKQWPTEIIGNEIVIGQSRLHQINHLKLIVVDGLFTVGGSTNLSDSGEKKQNNELIIIRDAVYAAESRAKIDLCFSEMKRQMGVTK